MPPQRKTHAAAVPERVIPMVQRCCGRPLLLGPRKPVARGTKTGVALFENYVSTASAANSLASVKRCQSGVTKTGGDVKTRTMAAKAPFALSPRHTAVPGLPRTARTEDVPQEVRDEGTEGAGKLEVSQETCKTQKRSHLSHRGRHLQLCRTLLDDAGRNVALATMTLRDSISDMQNLHGSDESNPSVVSSPPPPVNNKPWCGLLLPG